MLLLDGIRLSTTSDPSKFVQLSVQVKNTMLYSRITLIELVICRSLWETRFNKQVMDIHWAAYHLDPDHQPIAMTPISQANVLRYMLKIVAGDAEKRELHQSCGLVKKW